MTSDAALEEMFGFIGGDPAVDLVNTIHWRLAPERSIDALEGYGHLAFWAAREELITPEERRALERMAGDDPRSAARAVAEAKRLREAAYLVLRGADDDGRIRGAVAAAQRRARFDLTGGSWGWHDAELTLRSPVDRTARALAALLERGDAARIGQCADDACGWIFIDDSRRGNRRWCSPAGCGDRNRAREYYRRRTGA